VCGLRIDGVEQPPISRGHRRSRSTYRQLLGLTHPLVVTKSPFMREHDTDHDFASEMRKLRRRTTAGDAVCTRCGESDPTVLVKHHAAKRSNDPDLIAVLCHNCHYRSHETLRDVGVSDRPPDDRHLLERLQAWLMAVAAFLVDLVDALLRIADQLAAHIAAMDARSPGWREIT
ncbi:MAG: hypothetical protein M3O70_18620, partial [Actinomycetota bacterium]|nr:hypothetical protein [Actinomycetota bacterium]